MASSRIVQLLSIDVCTPHKGMRVSRCVTRNASRCVRHLVAICTVLLNLIDGDARVGSMADDIARTAHCMCIVSCHELLGTIETIYRLEDDEGEGVDANEKCMLTKIQLRSYHEKKTVKYLANFV
jgi:hypothetical protein